MKRLYLLSIIALLLAGCAEEITNHNDSGRFLRFSVAEETNTTPSLTRVEGTDTPTSRIDSLESDYDEPLCMIVSTAPIGQEAATRGTEVATSSLNASGKSIQVSSTLFNGEANYNTTSQKFEPATATSWNGASSTSVTFSAWHPVNSALSAAGLSVSGTTFTYSLPTSSSAQTDLIGTTESHTYAEQNNGDVALTFKHLLAPVKFVLAANLKGQITGIKFSSIVKAGTHVLGTTNATTGQTWTSTSTGEYTATVSGTGSTSAVQVDGSEYFMMIPQTVAAGVVMTVTITDLAGTSNTLTYTVPSGGQVWKAGVVTTYTISTTAITSFTVAYPSWTDASTSAAVAGPVTTYTTSDYFGLFAVDKAGKIVIANAQVKVTTAGATATCNLADAANSGQFTNVIPSQNYTYYLMYPYVSDITTTYPAIALNASAPGGGSGTADTFFANVISGWTVSITDQNTTYRNNDLQVGKASGAASLAFSVTHKMGLVKMTMGTNASAVTTITYDGNTSTEKYRSSTTTSTTSLAVFDNFTPLTSSTTYYLIVKPSTAYTLNSGYKVTTTSGTPVYQWSQSVTNSAITSGKCKAYTPTPAFRNFARLYSYTGSCQTFTPILANKKYQMECWGASGGYGTGNHLTDANLIVNEGTPYSETDGNGSSRYLYPYSNQGKGGYVTGKITLTNTTALFVFVGQAGYHAVVTNNQNVAWNGGGKGSWDQIDEEACGGGGGATDIRTVQGSSSTTWNGVESICSRIMVAGGGGGSGPWNSYGGCGGNTTGGSDSYYGESGYTVTTTAGSQTNGYRFGQGGDGESKGNNYCIAGGGGGYWGAAIQTTYITANRVEQAGAGGSSFISGHSGCKAVKSSAKTLGSLASITSSYFESHANHYSGYVFISGSTNMINGGSSMPNPTIANTSNSMTGNSGNGYARITCIPYD